MWMAVCEDDAMVQWKHCLQCPTGKANGCMIRCNGLNGGRLHPEPALLQHLIGSNLL